MKRNRFTNPNVEPWFRWIWRRKDSLPGVTLYFLSRRNSTSGRFFPLYDSTKNFRVVLIKGFRAPYLDKISLKFLKLFSRIFSSNFSRYPWVSLSDSKVLALIQSNIVLHIDDPEYSELEKDSLLCLLRKQREKNKKFVVIVTNTFTRNYFSSFLPKENLKILSQGFNKSNKNNDLEKFERFSLVYSSPYIDYLGDKHAYHESWSAIHLIDELLPRICKDNTEIEIHLIGRVGKNAQKAISRFSIVSMHGLLSIEENSRLITRCHVGIYPRNSDSRRSVLKIFDYIGSGLPVVTYNLVDTEIIKRKNLGIAVESAEEFSQAVEKLASNRSFYDEIRANVLLERSSYSWDRLAKAYDSLVEEI
jgi:glycosyltransferase involved in cell wall biosynthesis